MKEVYEVYIVSLVVEKAVNYNVDVPQNQRVWRKELRDCAAGHRMILSRFSVLYSAF